MPFYQWSLTAARPIPGYPEKIEHIGHQILRRRLDLGLLQKAAAKLLGVHPGGLENWEYGRTAPADRFYPAIISFLGVNPLPAARTRGGVIRRERITRGWSRKHLAFVAAVDEATIKRLENDTPRMARQPVRRVLKALTVTF